jgi:SAM-dependent methyltransferase
MSYFGIFKQLRELNLTICEDNDLYRGELAKIYDLLVKDSQDLELYQNQAAITGPPILELACGSGRVLLNLAQEGYDITGIDLSTDMLCLLKEKIDKLPNRFKSKIEYGCADMKNFKLNKQFNLIILPATTICLLKNETEIEMMLRSVFNHLADGGRFVFDYTTPMNGDTQSFDSPINIWTGESANGEKQFVLYGECRNYLESKAAVNFYSEIESKGTTKRIFGFTEKNITTEKILMPLIQKIGFKVIKIIDKHGLYANDYVKIAILKKGDFND